MKRTRLLASLFTALVLLAFSSPAAAQDMFEDFELGPGFLPDPAVGHGIAGAGVGSVDASSYSSDNGGNCAGTIDSSPDHNLTVTGDFDNLRIRATSEGDTTLVIRKPNGRYYCSDDAVGLDPEVEAAFPAGDYGIFVGSYGGGNPEYELEISELPHGETAGDSNSGSSGVAADVSSDDYYEDITLSPGFMPDPSEGYGRAGGPRDADSVTNGQCLGSIDTTPDHTVTLESAFSYLSFRIHSDEDTTLVIQGPNGTFYCNDDSDGLDPKVDGSFAAGDYQVYVGTYGDGYPEYRLEVSEIE